MFFFPLFFVVDFLQKSKPESKDAKVKKKDEDEEEDEEEDEDSEEESDDEDEDESEEDESEEDESDEDDDDEDEEDDESDEEDKIATSLTAKKKVRASVISIHCQLYSFLTYYFCIHNGRQKCCDTLLLLGTLETIHPSPLKYPPPPLSPKQCWACYLQDLLCFCTTLKRGRFTVCTGFEVHVHVHVHVE